MPLYQPLIPTGLVDLDEDYQNIQGNFEQLNIVYGTDHYPFDNATPNQGFHNIVTTPAFVDNPATGLPPVTTTNPKLYAFQQYAALGVLQYSRGPNSAVPTPLTSIHSSATPIVLTPATTTNVLDFTGFSFAMGTLSAFNAVGAKRSITQPIFWSANAFATFISQTGLVATSSGNILQILNNTGGTQSDVYWTLQLIRVQ